MNALHKLFAVPIFFASLILDSQGAFSKPALQLVRSIPMPDVQGDRVFINLPDSREIAVSRMPASLLVYDADSGKMTTHVSAVGDVDDLFYDTKRKRLYLSGGEGLVQVFQQAGPDSYFEIEKIPISKGARTSLWVPELDFFYLAKRRQGDQSASGDCFRAVD